MIAKYLRYRMWNPFMEQITGVPGVRRLGRTSAGSCFLTSASGGSLRASSRHWPERQWPRLNSRSKAPQPGISFGSSTQVRRFGTRKARSPGLSRRCAISQAEAVRQGAACGRARRPAQEAEKLAATGRIATRIAHEINNPLAGIRETHSASSGMRSPRTARTRLRGTDQKEIDRLARTVRLMYDLHRPNQERKSDVLLEETFQDVVLLLEPLYRQHAVRGDRTAAAAGPHPYSRGGHAASPLQSRDERRRNLAAGRRGPSWDGRGPRGPLLVSVSDQGHGIPDELRDRIFEPFFSTKTGKGVEGEWPGAARRPNSLRKL